MEKEKLVHLAGVMITNGVAKFHVIGDNQAKQKYVQLPMPLFTKASWDGKFEFVTFVQGLTKLEAATAMLGMTQFGHPAYQAVLREVIGKKTPKVKAPKVPKAPKVVTPKAAKPVKAASEIMKDALKPSMEKLKKIQAAAKRA